MSVSLFSLSFEQLEIGARHTTERRLITAGDVDAFAALTGDRHPVHTDPAWAATSPFGGRIAHGMLVISAAVGALPLDPERVIALRRVSDVVFKRPLAVGEGITVRCEVTGKRELDRDTGLVSCEWRIEGDDRRLRARASVEVLWRRDERAGDPDPDGASSPVEVTGNGVRVLI